MSEVILRIGADASGVKAGLAETVAANSRAVAQIHADSRRASTRERTQASNDAALKRQLQRQEYADRVRALNDKKRADEAAAAARAKLDVAGVNNAAKSERQRTGIAARESNLRLALAARETDRAERLKRDEVRSAERSEKEKTRLAEREARERVRTEARWAAEVDRIHRQLAAARRARTEREEREHRQRSRDVGGRILGVAGALGSGAAEYGSAMHGQIQDARQSRATADRALGNAVRNAGGSREDASAARTRVRRFVEETGMSYADVASALSTGQERGSALEAGEGRTRSQTLEESLSIVREANAEGADPGQYLAARGRLSAAGFRGNALRDAMRFALAAAQSGQVEVDQLLQQGLPGASRLMDARVSALGPGATEAQRQTARLAAWRESVATQEVLAASGGNAGHTANTLASLQGFLNTPRRQEMALTNIRTAESQINTRTPEGRARAAALHALYEGDNALFERDPTRRDRNAMRLRQGVSPIELATRVAGATGGNAQAGANIFAGGGHGNAQAFLVNMRNLMGVLGGERGQKIQQMMGGAGLSDETIAGHQREVEGDELSQLTRAQEAGANALTDNTREIVNLSRQFADWSARNPFEAQGVQTGASTASNVVGAVTGGGAAAAVGRRVLAATSFGRTLLGKVAPRVAGAAMAGGGLLGGLARGVFGIPSILASALQFGGAYGGTSQEEAQRQQREGGEWQRQSTRLTTAAREAHRPPPTAAEIGAAVAAALRGAPITATVAPTPPTSSTMPPTP
ncbi:MAG: hypothetical protein Q8S73_26555 [Deltaproteobacteria bacterium]|nr:hypothetical protein [Myxococcales bacterium]MDP3217697.1 hypothetical protein [Deltaproteobacteria bacterium]